MSQHQETLTQVVKRIEASFDKINSYSKKADDHRITAGTCLVALKARIDAGEDGKHAKWWAWYAEHFKDRSKRDAQRVMALASSDDPEAAAEEEREKNRKAQADKRERDKEQPDGTTDVSRDLTDPRWTEEDHAAQIVRGVQDEVANLEGEVADLDLLRELILQKLTFAFRPEDSAAASADARKALYGASEDDDVTTPKRRGRKVKPEPASEPVEDLGTDDLDDIRSQPWVTGREAEA
jgi:hypothetical protein